ncbi:hypothetical protein ACFYWY_29325 [Streptomyces sp. NPDC002870]|uniref:hypothetical protein n=1 Tax=Streptomyces sp. NPDC002870 TaxID=3364666 RepID=UPI0036940773
MKITKIQTVAAAGVVGLLATGCGSEGGSDNTDAKPKPGRTVLTQKLTKPTGGVDLEPAASPAADAPFAETVAYELQRKTLSMASASGKTTGQCPKAMGSKTGTKATCTTTYQGVEVVWDVTIGEKSGWSDNVVKYEAFPRQALLVRAGVARHMLGDSDVFQYALCNDIPEAVLVPFGETKYKCEKVGKNREPIGYNETVRITDTGPTVH